MIYHKESCGVGVPCAVFGVVPLVAEYSLLGEKPAHIGADLGCAVIIEVVALVAGVGCPVDGYLVPQKVHVDESQPETAGEGVNAVVFLHAPILGARHAHKQQLRPVLLAKGVDLLNIFEAFLRHGLRLLLGAIYPSVEAGF